MLRTTRRTREDAYLPHCTMIAFDVQQLSLGFEFGFDDVFELTQVAMCGNMSAATRVAQWIRRFPAEEEIAGSSPALNTSSCVMKCCAGAPTSAFRP